MNMTRIRKLLRTPLVPVICDISFARDRARGQENIEMRRFLSWYTVKSVSFASLHLLIAIS